MTVPVAGVKTLRYVIGEYCSTANLTESMFYSILSTCDDDVVKAVINTLKKHSVKEDI